MLGIAIQQHVYRSYAPNINIWEINAINCNSIYINYF